MNILVVNILIGVPIYHLGNKHELQDPNSGPVPEKWWQKIIDFGHFFNVIDKFAPSGVFSLVLFTQHQYE